MSKVVKEWAPIKINQSPSQPKPLQSSSSLKDIPNTTTGGSFKTNQSSQNKNVAFNEKTPAQSSNTSAQLKRRSGIFYDISAGRGNFDDGYHSDYTHSLKQSYSVGNLDMNSSNNNTHKPHSSNQFHSSSSVNSFSNAESNNYSSYNQNQKKSKSGQRSNNNRINRSGSYSQRNSNDRNSGDKYRPPNSSNYKTNSNNNFNSNNNRFNRPNNQDNNFQPKQQTQQPTNS